MPDPNPQANLNLRLAAETSPDDAAQNAAIARRFNVPVAAVEADRSLLQKRAAAQDNADTLTLQNAFKTQRWIASDPQNAKVASDDVGTLGSIENFISHPLSSLKSGIIGAGYAFDRWFAEDSERPITDYPGSSLITAATAPIAALAGDKTASSGLGKAAGSAGSALLSGVYQTGANVAYAFDWLNQTAGPQAVDRALFGPTSDRLNPFLNIGKAADRRAAAAMPSTDSYIANQILAGISQAPATGLSLAGGIGARAFGATVEAAAGVGSILGGAQQGGRSFETARAQGVSPGVASLYALTDAATETAGEYLGERTFLRATDEGSSVLGRFVKSLLPEVTGEEFSTVSQDLSAYMVLPENKDKTLGDFISQLPGDMAATAIQTATAMGLVNVTIGGIERATNSVASQTRREISAQRLADQQRGHFDALMRLAEQSKLRERDPASFESFMQTATEDGPLEHIYVDANALAQSLEADPPAAAELLAKMPSASEQLAEAARTGGDMRIPTSELATALPGSPLEQAVVDHLRVDPLAQSAAERTAETEETINRLAQSFQEQAAAERMTTESEQSRDAVTQKFIDQLAAVDRFTPATNEQYASLLGNFYAVQGAKIGLTAEEMAQRYPLEIRAAESATQLPNRMQQNAPYLNIGLNTELAGDGTPLTVDDVRKALAANGVEPQEITVAPSAFEPTAIVRLAKPLTPEQGRAISKALHQEAIAQRRGPGNEGDLFGPKAEAWGPYNPDYFVMPEAANTLAQSGLRDPRAEFVAGQLGRSIVQLLDMAARNQQRLAEIGARLRQQTGIDFVNPGVKRRERVEQKFVQGGYTDPGELTDLSRGAFLVTRVEQADVIVRELIREGSMILDRGWTRTEANYVDRKLLVRFPNGGIAELQIRPEPVHFYAESEGHRLYEIYRDVSLAERERQAALRKMSAAYARLIAGSDFEAAGNAVAKRSGESGEPSTTALARSQSEAGFQTPPENTEAVSPSIATGRNSSSNSFMGTSTTGDRGSLILSQGTKAVDKNGNLLTLYHGTAYDFDTFRNTGKAVWFAEDRKQAEGYANPRRIGRAAGGRILSVHLNVQNPLTVDGKMPDDRGIKGYTEDGTAWAREEFGFDLPAFGWERTGAMYASDVIRSAAFADAARAAGFDAIKQTEDGKTTWGALYPNTVVDAESGNTLFQGERGFIQFGDDVTANASVITLLNASDLSTLLHESGHFFLEVMSHMAASTDAPASLLKDMNGALKWMGIDGIAAWQNMTLEEKRPYHEKFARGFEAYLFEGKAPNFELRSLFRTFKQWLVAVYRNSIERLHAPLNAEIRGVFDRMVASADTIAEAQQAAYLAPFFDTKPDTMTDAEWRDYQALGTDATAEAVDELQSRSLRDMRFAGTVKARELKRLQKEAEAARQGVEDEVRAEVSAQPVYAALQFIKSGEINGEAQDGEHFLNVAAFNALYGEDQIADREAAKRKIGFRNFRREGGVDPTQVAEAFGFGSGKELANALLAAEPMETVIEGETDARTLERYGDITSDNALDRAASDAIHNEVRLRFVATELSALDKAIGKPRALAIAARQAARDIVGRLKLREVKPSQFEAAERRAAKAAERARKDNNVPLAAQAKRNQLLNLYATREARRAIDDARKAVDYFRKFSKKGVRENLDADYLDQIDAMLERFDFRVTGLDEAQLARRAQKATLTAWIENQRENGFEPIFSNDMLFADENQRKNYRDLTLDEMRGLRDAIKNIEHLARARNTLLKGIEQMALAEAKERGAAAVNENAYKIVKEPLGARTWLERAKAQVDDFLAMHRKFSSLIREMDGNEDRGQLWRLFSQPMNRATDTEAAMTADATAKLHDLFSVLRNVDTHKRELEPAIGRSISLETRLSIALNMGNQVNLERIMSGEGWTAEQVNAVTAPLTTDQWRFVQNVWDFIGSYWDQIADKERRVTGVAPERVEASPVTVKTADGDVLTLPGGYYPIKYDPDRSSRAEADTAAEIQQQLTRGLYTRAQTRRGHTKARVESTGRPLRYDFGVTFEHVQQVVHDLSWHETLIDMNRLLRSGAIESAIRQHYGPAALRWMRKALEDIAIGGIGAQSSFERGINYLRTGATVAGLGWNFMTALLQPLGLTNSVARIGPKYVARGVARAFTDAVSLQRTSTWIYEQSDFMRLRGQTMQREIAEVRQNFEARGPIASTLAKVPGAPVAMDAVSASFFYLIERAQRIADIPTWAGAYEKAVDQGAAHTEAVAFADQAVRDSQGGGQISDLAGIQRGSPMMKLWTNFYSWFSVAYNQMAESVNQTKRVGASRLPILAADALLIMVMPQLIMSLIHAALDGDDKEKLLARVGNDQASGWLGMVIGLRELGAAFGVGNDYQGPAGARVFSAAVNLGKQAQQGEADAAFWKAVNQTSGVLFHYPAVQVQRTVQGVEALANGETRNPLVVVTGSPKK